MEHQLHFPVALKPAIAIKNPVVLKSQTETYMNRQIEDDWAHEHINILRASKLRKDQNVSVLKLSVDAMTKYCSETTSEDAKIATNFITGNMFKHHITNYKKGKRTLMMIYASGVNRCGGMIRAGKAQEEQGCSISDLPYILELYDCKEKIFYDGDRVVLFVKNASFVVDTEGKEIDPIPCDFVFLAAPRLDRNTKADRRQDEFMQKLIQTAFCVVANKGFDENPYDAVYFGPLGCGCFNWDMSTVAKYFKTYQQKYAKSLPEITYCVFDEKSLPTFKNAF